MGIRTPFTPLPDVKKSLSIPNLKLAFFPLIAWCCTFNDRKDGTGVEKVSWRLKSRNRESQHLRSFHIFFLKRTQVIEGLTSVDILMYVSVWIGKILRILQSVISIQMFTKRSFKWVQDQRICTSQGVEPQGGIYLNRAARVEPNRVPPILQIDYHPSGKRPYLKRKRLGRTYSSEMWIDYLGSTGQQVR